MTQEPLLEVDDLTIQYETTEGMLTAVSEASFTVSEKEYFGLVGESGCGKSTIAKALIGALDDNGHVTSGSIRFKGQALEEMSEKQLNREIRWKEISYIPQSSMNSLDRLERISDQAVEIAQVHTDMTAAEVKERLRTLFETVGLNPDRIADYPHQFSGGMEQRAIIAFALLLDPSLIIADEPTTALDVIMQDQIFKHLEQAKEEFDLGMVLITHDISLVFESCSRIGVMHGGQISEVSTSERVFQSPQHPYTILLQRAFPDHRHPERELDTIKGDPPQYYGEVPECTFVERCPWATDECRQSQPPLEPVGDEGHLVSCFRTEAVQESLQAEREQADEAEVTGGE